jgi:hypothetical protein
MSLMKNTNTKHWQPTPFFFLCCSAHRPTDQPFLFPLTFNENRSGLKKSLNKATTSVMAKTGHMGDRSSDREFEEEEKRIRQ